MNQMKAYQFNKQLLSCARYRYHQSRSLTTRIYRRNAGR